MPRLAPRLSPQRAVRLFLKVVAGALGVVLFLWLAKALLMPDPAATLFARAQRLEVNGLWEQALRHYALLAETQPASPFAPRALQQEAVILTGMARRSGDESQFRQAVALYQKLAEVYPGSPQAGEALLAAGELAVDELRDTRAGARFYDAVLERFPHNREYASEATLRLGRIALLDGNGSRAQELFQRVLQQYQRFKERCAEAQYHLGVTYETLLRKPEWAQNAYQAVIDNYPASPWVNNAKERLGLLYFAGNEGRPAARHVEIQTAPLPAEGFAADSPLAALLPLLAARGLEPGETVLRGWSLAPFYAGFNPQNPGQVIALQLDRFDTIAANAGLLYSPLRNDSSKAALRDLQDEVDAARPPMIYHGAWSLVVGYDTQRDEVLLQNQGARVDTVPVAELVKSWKQPAPDGSPARGPWALLRFYTPGQKPQLVKTPQPPDGAKTVNAASLFAPTPAPRETPSFTVPGLGLTPTIFYKLPPLSARDAHRRTLRRARDLLMRSQSGGALLNAAALDALARELDAAATPPPARRTESAARDAERSPLPVPEEELATNEDVATPLPAATTPSTPSPAAGSRLEHLRTLRAWFNAPLRHWLAARRDAANYMRVAAGSLNSAAARQAAAAFDREVEALKNAAALMPSELSADEDTLSEDARHALQAVAVQLRAARDAEKRALAALE